ncbi:uncharacterized protein EV420DRAFT_1129332 [Desarmillaria tabescens]|uniref:Mid2 domain-containing protein n=1 Tax=Armillaria tabescens TaxID=1929756 RepID=A0AA39MNX3_ARMTA|nr:uncharacterized protein EV420DRAFT_1129332 [Desarmillaria tabescens]KAK0440883.1 hypothetical protein EV420DRAFT_1129332 [Desarmillaria tabescens]
MAFFTLFPLLLFNSLVAGELFNHTIDDTLGDELTGFQVEYSPASQPSNVSELVWKNASHCSDCSVVPDNSLAMNGTWTGVTYYPSLRNTTARLTFHGSAIYVYLIISNYPKSTGFVSDAICDLRMDGEVVGSYSHDSDGTYQFEYDVLAYSNASLSDEDHTLLIETTGTKPSYIIFDYVVYTNTRSSILLPSLSTQQDSVTSSESFSPSSGAPSALSLATTSSSSLAKTFGGAIAVGVLALVILAGSLAFYLRRRRRRPTGPATPSMMAHPSDFFHPSNQMPQRPTAVFHYDAESSTDTLTTQVPAPAAHRREIRGELGHF